MQTTFKKVMGSMKNKTQTESKPEPELPGLMFNVDHQAIVQSDPEPELQVVDRRGCFMRPRLSASTLDARPSADLAKHSPFQHGRSQYVDSNSPLDPSEPLDPKSATLEEIQQGEPDDEDDEGNETIFGKKSGKRIAQCKPAAKHVYHQHPPPDDVLSRRKFQKRVSRAQISRKKEKYAVPQIVTHDLVHSPRNFSPKSARSVEARRERHTEQRSTLKQWVQSPRGSSTPPPYKFEEFHDTPVPSPKEQLSDQDSQKTQHSRASSLICGYVSKNNFEQNTDQLTMENRFLQSQIWQLNRRQMEQNIVQQQQIWGLQDTMMNMERGRRSSRRRMGYYGDSVFF